jgi:tRNA pseudouridine65 synthase
MTLEILYQDEHLVAINKPPDLLVHRTRIAKDVKEFALQMPHSRAFATRADFS